MKKILLSWFVVAMLCASVQADNYSDAQDDIFDTGFPHLDILNVEVTNDQSNIIFNVTMLGDLDVTTWGKYCVGIDTGNFAGVNSNGWGRNVNWDRNITHYIGSWADDGGSGAGGEIWEWDGSAWVVIDATYLAGTDFSASDAGHSAGVQSFSVSMAALGIGFGDTFEFDVFSTGGTGNDPGVDHLSRNDPATPGWSDPSVAGTFLTFTPIPEPGSLGFLALVGGAMLLRRKR